MKILTIGLDGGDQRINRAMPMPNLHKLLDKNICLDIEEDLWSRGWAKILCGLPGHESGAYYAKPLLDGTHNTTQKFSVTDYDDNPDIQTLWDRINQQGYRVGFMNLPTTIPAQKVQGFMVSGAGGGYSPKNGLPQLACYPSSIHEYLQDIEYIWERRPFRDIDKDALILLDDVSKAVDKRTEAFLMLCDKFETDYSFVMHKATTVVQNLAMSEIEALIQNANNPQNPLQEKILSFYTQIDEQIGRLIDGLKPQHVLLVSDHGQSPRLYSVNVNTWLVQAGYQHPLKKGASLMKWSVKTLAGFLPQSLKKAISSSAPGIKAKVGGMSADWNKTTAFGVRYIPGIYINDQKRFSGPVQNQQKAEQLVDEIIQRFNSDTTSQEHGFKAYPYRSRHMEARHEKLLPDIWIDHDDTYFFEQHGDFVETNKEYGPISSLEKVDRDMYTGIKGRYPLLCVDQSLASLVKNDDHRDLTLAYKIITRGMNT